MKKALELVGMFGAGTGMLVLVALLALLGPILFMVCWNFAAPLFWEGAPRLDFLHAIAVVVGLQVLQRSASASTRKRE